MDQPDGVSAGYHLIWSHQVLTILPHPPNPTPPLSAPQETTEFTFLKKKRTIMEPQQLRDNGQSRIEN